MTSVFWFRKSLRLHDNEGLFKVAESTTRHVCLYIHDSKEIIGQRRAAFNLECLINLNSNLEKSSSRLFVLNGQATTILEELFIKDPKLTLHYEVDYDPYSKSRDKLVDDLAIKHKIKVEKYYGHTLFIPEQVLKRNNGKAPLTYQSFLKAALAIPVPDIIPTPTRFKSPINNLLFSNLNIQVPSIQLFGFDKDDFEGLTRHLGGETEALKQLDLYTSNIQQTMKFEKPNTSPTAFSPASTTVLSPHLRFGSLSCKKFYKLLRSLEKVNANHSKPPTSLVGQLLWREFYYCVGSSTPNFDCMLDNPICMQIPWKLSNVGDSSPEFEAWKYGRTGYPFIDAIMIQLRTEGWIHHLARHSVACFLTRGDLYISWERGKEVFEELLLDADWALNAGNWMWLSASAFFHQYFKVYSPIAFGKKSDPKGEYIRRYLPALKNVPDKYIYEPWKMTKAEQNKANCVIGFNYPEPIVDHEKAKKECLTGLSIAYQAKRDSTNSTL